MAFIEPMHHSKPNITSYLCFAATKVSIMSTYIVMFITLNPILSPGKKVIKIPLEPMFSREVGNSSIYMGWFNITMPSYQYRKSHCGDKTILRPCYLHNGISYTSKMTPLYWIRALAGFLLIGCGVRVPSGITRNKEILLFNNNIFFAG